MRAPLPTQCRIILIAVLFVFGMLALGKANAEQEKPYNPQKDPTYRGDAAEKAPASGGPVRDLVEEYERRSLPPAEPPRVGPPPDAVQPQSYTATPPPSDPRADAPGAFYCNSPVYLGYPYGCGTPWWWETSPRIPWWSLTPFTKEDKDSFRHKDH